MTAAGASAIACKRCSSTLGRDRPADLTAYWGDPICRPCAQEAAAYFDKRNAWPPVSWDDVEEVLDGA